VCHTQLHFGNVFNLDILADFEGGDITSDAGGLILKEIDQAYCLTDTMAKCLTDGRQNGKIKHTLLELLRQRIYQIALGYEDQNDADELRRDPSLKVMSGRRPKSDPDLGSQPTLSRFENHRCSSDLYRLSDALVDLYIQCHPGPRTSIMLDMDATDDPTHGQQEFTFFHGYYEQYMYHPLFLFDGEDGFPLAAMLRPGNTHASHRAAAILKRLIRRLKDAYPEATIFLRADAGFAIPELYDFFESNDIRYVIGLITNDRLRGRVADLAAGVENRFNELLASGRVLAVASPCGGQSGAPRKRAQSTICGHEFGPGAVDCLRLDLYATRRGRKPNQGAEKPAQGRPAQLPSLQSQSIPAVAAYGGLLPVPTA
jgi:hypothetical protein